MTDADKHWIDIQPLETLLQHWRFAEPGSRLVSGDTGVYYSKVMFNKRDADNAAWVRASKIVGWG